MEFFEWVRENVWSAWFALAMVLGAAEMLTLDLTLLMLAGGAIAAGLTAIVLPGVVIVQVIVGIVAAIALLFLLRPTLLAKVRNAPGYRSSLNQLVGAEAVATGEVTPAGGEVRINGELWTARLVVPGSIAPGERVEVQEVRGTTLMVYPLEGVGGDPWAARNPAIDPSS
ncbi:NfeD family protein [Propionibacteriaceae bacterium G1746]|uniref:NfeD family protein n=1 Tax=Aestuariimicrobium sp. G57 TaxID=3418485 RepID=UPI003C22F408